MKNIPKSSNFWHGFLTDSSKMLVDAGVNLCIERKQLFEPLMELIEEDCGQKSQRAVRVASYAIVRYPSAFGKYKHRILDALVATADESCAFNLMRVFAESDLDPKDEDTNGILLDYCLNALESGTKKEAIRVYGITILHKLTEFYPELIPELKLLLAKHSEGAKMAFVSRANQILKKLK